MVALLALGVSGCSSDGKKKEEPAPNEFAMDECGLNTGYAGDENCILPPPPDQGFQVHVGPTDYDNPEADYLMQPSDENTPGFQVISPNDTDVFFFYRQFRMRPTAHHVILTVPNDTGTPTSALDVIAGRRIGTANVSQDYPAGGQIAPEDRSVGLPLAPHTPININFHAINTDDQPQLRELWVNFWYRDPAEVTQPAIEWFNGVDIGLSIAPRETKTLSYTCSVQGDGRLLWLYGHRHANNVRFTATRVRGTQRDVIYDGNNWEEPLLLEYSSIVENRAPDLAAGVEGGWNGILDLLNGDTIEWTCDVVNQTDGTLRFTNNTFTGEMCIIDAEAVGSSCSGW